MATSARKENRWRNVRQGENDAQGDRRREIEAAFLQRGPRPTPIAPPPQPSRRQVRSWMREHADEYEGATHLAEAANAALDLPAGWLDIETHWVWDEAQEATERTHGPESR